MKPFTKNDIGWDPETYTVEFRRAVGDLPPLAEPKSMREFDEVLAERAAASGPKWYCLYTTPRGEARAAEKLREAGYQAYAPTLRKRVKVMRGGRRRERILDLPLIIRYIFVEMDADDSWFAVKETDGVVDFLRNEVGAPQSIPKIAVEDLMTAEDMGLFDETKNQEPIFKAGEHVKIIEGPFTGFPAIVERALGGETAKVLVEIFGRLSPANIELEHLRRAA